MLLDFIFFLSENRYDIDYTRYDKYRKDVQILEYKNPPFQFSTSQIFILFITFSTKVLLCT